MKVRYIGKTAPGILTHGKIYEVVLETKDDYCIVDDDDDGDYAFQKCVFEIVEE